MDSQYRHQDQDAALEHFICSPVTEDMISYLAFKATEVIQCETFPTTAEMNQHQVPTPPTTPPPAMTEADLKIPTLEQFITSLVVHSNVQVPTLMTTLLYLHRLKQKLPPVAKGLRCTTHRIFLACLILSAKFLNDSSPKNKHWAAYSRVPSTLRHDFSRFGFSRTEVNLMEKQLLYLLDWDLNFALPELEAHFEHFLAPIRKSIDDDRRVRRRHRDHIAQHEAQRHAQRQRYADPQNRLTPDDQLAAARLALDDFADFRMDLGDAAMPAVPRTMYPSAKAYKAHVMGHMHAHTPSASNVPGLSRSGTVDTLASFLSGGSSGPSSRASSRSRSNTPASSVSSMKSFQDVNIDMYTEGYGAADPYGRNGSVGGHDYYGASPAQVYMAVPTHGKVQPEVPMYDESAQPASKRARLGMGRQNILSRFLSSRN